VSPSLARYCRLHRSTGHSCAGTPRSHRHYRSGAGALDSLGPERPTVPARVGPADGACVGFAAHPVSDLATAAAWVPLYLTWRNRLKAFTDPLLLAEPDWTLTWRDVWVGQRYSKLVSV
jgi:hypothetical protein